MRRPVLGMALAMALAAVVVVAPASAQSGLAVFEPTPMSQPLYGVQPPDVDPARQQHVVEAADGVDLYVETWLPVAQDGNVPPAELPTILVMTPYAALDELAGFIGFIPPYLGHFVQRGYAVSKAHVRGTGRSGGCIEQTGANQIDDGARVVEYLGRDAPWSNGNVGMYGLSYEAETQLSVAGLGDPAMTKYLKAIIPAASVGGQYEYSFFDGVPYVGWALTSNFTFYLGVSLLPSMSAPNPGAYLEKPGCQPTILDATIDEGGDWSPYWEQREYRPAAGNIRAATLWVHGLADFNVLPISAAGFFDRIPESTPHKGLFGIWEHAFPDDHGVHPEWNRLDWLDMATAWFDRYLKGLATGVEDWPDVQVQGTDGQWRVEPEWPRTGGPVGHLALGPDGSLGAESPTGSTTYSEGLGLATLDPTASAAVFETGPLPGRLELTGQPVLDLWVTLDQPDAHVVAELEAFDGEGNPIPQALNWSMRSMQHLDPVIDGRFRAVGTPAPTGTPIHVEMRFLPTSMVVPEGGSLQLTVSGVLTVERQSVDPALNELGFTSSSPSGAGANVTILHDCEHTTALRFLMSDESPQVLEVRDPRTEAGESPIVSTGGSTASGLAVAPVCGQGPIRTPTLGPARESSAESVGGVDVVGGDGGSAETLPATGADRTVLVLPLPLLAALLAGRRRGRPGGSGLPSPPPA